MFVLVVYRAHVKSRPVAGIGHRGSARILFRDFAPQQTTRQVRNHQGTRRPRACHATARPAKTTHTSHLRGKQRYYRKFSRATDRRRMMRVPRLMWHNRHAAYHSTPRFGAAEPMFKDLSGGRPVAPGTQLEPATWVPFISGS